MINHLYILNINRGQCPLHPYRRYLQSPVGGFPPSQANICHKDITWHRWSQIAYNIRFNPAAWHAQSGQIYTVFLRLRWLYKNHRLPVSRCTIEFGYNNQLLICPIAQSIPDWCAGQRDIGYAKSMTVQLNWSPQNLINNWPQRSCWALNEIFYTHKPVPTNQPPSLMLNNKLKGKAKCIRSLYCQVPTRRTFELHTHVYRQPVGYPPDYYSVTLFLNRDISKPFQWSVWYIAVHATAKPIFKRSPTPSPVHNSSRRWILTFLSFTKAVGKIYVRPDSCTQQPAYGESPTPWPHSFK